MLAPIPIPTAIVNALLDALVGAKLRLGVEWLSNAYPECFHLNVIAIKKLKQSNDRLHLCDSMMEMEAFEICFGKRSVLFAEKSLLRSLTRLCSIQTNQSYAAAFRRIRVSPALIRLN